MTLNEGYLRKYKTRQLAYRGRPSLSLPFESEIYDIKHTYIHAAVNTSYTPPSSFEV